MRFQEEWSDDSWIFGYDNPCNTSPTPNNSNNENVLNMNIDAGRFKMLVSAIGDEVIKLSEDLVNTI
jgi:hypothetical protein